MGVACFWTKGFQSSRAPKIWAKKIPTTYVHCKWALDLECCVQVNHKSAPCLAFRNWIGKTWTKMTKELKHGSPRTLKGMSWQLAFGGMQWFNFGPKAFQKIECQVAFLMLNFYYWHLCGCWRHVCNQWGDRVKIHVAHGRIN